MSRFLFATQPITGHILPGLPIVQELVAQGHQVVWYTGQKFRNKVEATGATFAPFQEAYDYDDSDYDAAFAGRSALKGLEQIKFDFIHLFMKQIGPQHNDIQSLLRNFPADALVADPSILATHAVNEKGGPPHAIYNITVLGIKGRDVAPFGLGMLPLDSALGRLRNRLLYWMASNVIFKPVSDEIGRQAVKVGVAPRKFEGVPSSPYLFLQPTVPSFEYPRSDLPEQVHYIGALTPEVPADFTPPVWWDEVTAKRRPVVVVTQGTVATDPQELIIPTLRALAQEDVTVIAAGVRNRALLGSEPLPTNAYVEAFVPFQHLLPHVDVYITNGGYGGVMITLQQGVPVIAGGSTEDKPDVGNRVAYSGVGLNLKTSTPTPQQIRDAVKKILSNKSYGQKARQMQAELARYSAPKLATQLLEQLARIQRPVRRNGNGSIAPQ
jgi:UDP:flavonoid glycosyltransferase YjiC (YdhE family)